jgi:hypothetical protein
MGTSDEENGVAPLENGTLGLLVVFNAVPLPWNDVMNEPAKNMLEAEEFEVMDSTSAAAPERPPKGAFDQESALVFHKATDEPGEVNLPPTQTLLSPASQYTALISPFGPLDPSAAKVPRDCAYDAMLVADVPFIDENEPAK